MEKEEIKKILENHLNNLSKISDCCDKETNPVMIYMISESLKVTISCLFFLDKL